MDISTLENKKETEEPLNEASETSPSLSKKFSRMSINVNRSPNFGRNISPTPSPKSPSLSRKTSYSASLKPEERPSPRRTSSASYGTVQSSAHTYKETTPAVIAASIAKEYFQKELVYHLGCDLQDTDTLVLTHDACYGHRFSRPKTARSTLGMIVERPERIQAGVIGLSNAYVRLAKRHAGGSHAPNTYNQPITNVPFRIRKTSRTVAITSPVVTAVHGTKWMQELKTMCDGVGEKLAAGGKELSRPETPSVIGSPPKPPLHEGDLYLCKESLNAFEGALGGVCEAVDTVFDEHGAAKNCKKAFVCIRPPGHHCSADWPSGFCWVNNVHVGIEHAIQSHGLTHAAIIDFDLHHGDGSQAIAWERNARSVKAQKSNAKNAAFKRSSVGYFSIHDINSYPCEDGDFDKVQRASVCVENAHGQNVWNIHLQPWATEADFWKLYENQYLVLLEKARSYLRGTTEKLKISAPAVSPKAAIFISAGFDASEWETPNMQRHNVNVPTEFYARMTSDVVKMAGEDGLATNGRVISVLEGGYSDRAISSGVLSHLSGLVEHRQSQDVDLQNSGQKTAHHSWDAQWWSDAALRELEDAMKPIAPPSAPVKKPTGLKEVPTYQTPTQSFTAKVVDPGKIQRHTSINMPTPPKSRPSTPPLPEVDWATAVSQLSQLLIPSDDRQVNSCRHEELSEPRKRERHSSIGISTIPPEPVGVRRQTRGRRTQLDGVSPKGLDDRRQQGPRLPAHQEVVDGVSGLDTGSSAVADRKQTKPAPRAQAKPRQLSTGSQTNLHISKSRRASVAKDGLAKTNMPPVSEPVQMKSVNQINNNNKAEVDLLTDGVKKITLKFPPREEQRDTQSAARKPNKKPTVARSTRKANSRLSANDAADQIGIIDGLERTAESADGDKFSAAKNAYLANCDTTKAPPSHIPDDVLPEQQNINNAHDDLASHTPADGETTDVAMREIPDSQEMPVPLSSREQAFQPSAPQDSNKFRLEFVPYQPDEMRAKDTEIPSDFHQGPIQWLPPNSNTPKRHSAIGKENLPTFTATGHIPFPSVSIAKSVEDAPATSSRVAEAETGSEQTPITNHDHGLHDSVWDVPPTPDRK